MSYSHHVEPHLIHRTGWLRAAVLGANDGIISVTSLIMGMAASGASSQTLLINIEEADLKLEARELDKNPHLELKELTQIYIQRGLNPELAHEVAVQLSAHDALSAHARDEIGIHENTSAKPLQAAGSSALAFSLGALLPMLAILLSPEGHLAQSVAITGVLSLLSLGALSSYFSGTAIWTGAIRVTLWGIFAMLFASWIGSLFNVHV